mmetsp:Transcript_45883/g.90427  ORF Transcript_45883/g.90427 Transcript_45883/m.90427 type:complete len:219 (-) Transcript_45883:55-711(-)
MNPREAATKKKASTKKKTTKKKSSRRSSSSSSSITTADASAEGLARQRSCSALGRGQGGHRKMSLWERKQAEARGESLPPPSSSSSVPTKAPPVSANGSSTGAGESPWQKEERLRKEIAAKEADLARQQEKQFLQAQSRERSASSAPSAAALAASISTFYSAAELETGNSLPSGVDPKNREFYLSDQEFFSIFGMNKLDFAKQPTWKKEKAKRAARLF